jgi:hypothetical protein
MHAAMEVAALVKRGVLSVIMPACANAMNYDMLLGVFGVFGVVMSYGMSNLNVKQCFGQC